MKTPTGSSISVDLPGHDAFSVHYRELGQGPAVVFLHGSGPGASGWSNFHANAEVWAQAGYRCVLPDLPGYGDSDMPAAFEYSFEALSTAVLALLDHLGLSQVVLLGNSMGGALAIKLALDHPERVSRLILMAPGGLESPETYMAMSGIRSMLKCIFGSDGITRDGMARVFAKQVFDSSLVSEALIDERTVVALRQPQGLWRTMRVPNQADRLRELQCPVLCFWGREDLFCPPSGALRVLEGCRDARVVMLTGCGHWVMVEHQAYFDRSCLDFLDNG